MVRGPFWIASRTSVTPGCAASVSLNRSTTGGMHRAAGRCTTTGPASPVERSGTLTSIAMNFGASSSLLSRRPFTSSTESGTTCGPTSW